MPVRKTDLRDLAIFGGEPAFGRKLHIGRPNIGNRDSLLERINKSLDDKWLTNMGPYVQEFERKLADYLGVKHCIAICNGTVALEIAIRALGLSGEVIVPSFTFVATAHALQWQEITPVFCDINPETYNLDPPKVEQLITPRTTGIIGVHLFGRPCDVKALHTIAEKHNLKLLFDAAHAFGCSYSGQMIGNWGDAEVFSFHATKFFNTLEGGAIATNNDELAEKIRLMKNFGFVGYDHVDHIGINGKMNEISAAMGLTNFESLEDFVNKNKANYEAYQKYLNDLPGITLISYDGLEKCNYQYIVVEVDKDILNISRDQIVKILFAENILVRRYFYPGCHRMEPYRSYFPNAGLLLPETETLSDKVMALPTGTDITLEEIDAIYSILQFLCENGSEVSRQLKGTK